MLNFNIFLVNHNTKSYQEISQYSIYPIIANFFPEYEIKIYNKFTI